MNICEFCKKNYSTKKTLSRHIKYYCKNKQNIELNTTQNIQLNNSEENNINNQHKYLENKISKLENELNEFNLNKLENELKELKESNNELKKSNNELKELIIKLIEDNKSMKNRPVNNYFIKNNNTTNYLQNIYINNVDLAMNKFNDDQDKEIKYILCTMLKRKDLLEPILSLIEQTGQYCPIKLNKKVEL
jgi:hypothetical protein